MAAARSIAVLVILLCSWSLWGGDQPFIDWKVFVNAHERSDLSFQFSWRQLPQEFVEPEIRYVGTFRLGERTSQENQYLVLPPHWLDYQVKINSYVLHRGRTDRFVGNIYRYQTFVVPSPVLDVQNTITITARGSRQFGGFRGENPLITNDPEDLFKYRVYNSLLNDVHYPIAIFSFLLGCFSLMLLRIREYRTVANSLLVSYIFMSIPYIALATDIYTVTNWGATFPFKFQQAFQVAMWHSVILFFLIKTGKQSQRLLAALQQKRSFIVIYGIPLALLSIAIGSSDELFFTLTSIYFPLLVIVSIAVLGLMNTRSPLFYSYLVCVISSLVGIYAEVFHSNFYPFAYGFLVINISGFFGMIDDIHRNAVLNRMVNKLVSRFVPGTVYDQIYDLMKGGVSYRQVLNETRGTSSLSTVLIDICDWGKLNSHISSTIPVDLVNRARIFAFAEIQRVMENHHLELIKTSGDNMRFCGGLFLICKEREKVIATRTVSAIKQLLQEHNRINAELRKQDLPVLEIKVSATFGITTYGIEQYTNRNQFDTQGHAVNAAYRIETGIDSGFYDSYGRNVAAVSQDLVNLIDDMNLLDAFSGSHEIVDKHGIKYHCHILRKSDEEVSLSDFTTAMGNFFKKADPQSTPPPKQSPHAESIEGSDKRAVSRERIYIGEDFQVTCHGQNFEITGLVLDYSSQGIAILFDKDQNVSNALLNYHVQLSFQLAGQTFTGEGDILRYEEKDIRGTKYDLLGLRIKSNASDSREYRYSIQDHGVHPTMTCKNPFSFKNNLNFLVSDLSSHGIGVIARNQGSCLLMGMKVKIHVVFPFTGAIECDAEVIHITVVAQNELRVGLRIDSSIDDYQRQAAHFLMFDSGDEITLRELRRHGFHIDSVAAHLKCRYPQNEADLDQIFRFRLKVMHGMGECLDITDPNKMADKYDAFSRHIMIFHKDKLVSTARVVFNDGQRSRVEHLHYKAEIPDYIFDEKFVEFSRGYVDEHYRGSDVYLTMVYHLGRIALESGNDYVIISCNEALLNKFYSHFGFKVVGTFSNSPDKWLLCYANMRAIVEGRIVNPTGWALGYGELHDYLMKQNKLNRKLIGTMSKGMQNNLKPLILNKIKKSRAS
ncbi:PilZ domain-containing protein [Pseudobacteriovorax antillogorgiicola]|uniref:Adenylate cyclase, class 3 n=1 Tax=Pseudobacteriovorax antillogorgiicola TaxID=1513793 RepID=A0A1Y6CDR8_9BACT|nr:PilZ domain-containing protein [Pseudobacteriovorax antillogorgiicola]TCS47997.1 class 3 adenylate cyclase [Pseudobacteriovorax antillogorgiicola]SMF58498.1 Adenylate cyclase, class 3 [Pseudobacteriovorax antillogorgiicola]